MIFKVTGKEPEKPEEYYPDKSPEYWCSWILALYQWKTCRSFKKIYQTVCIQELLYMYSTHHEADTSRAMKTLDMFYSQKHTHTYLQQIRENSGMSVSELAKWSNIDENIIIYFIGIRYFHDYEMRHSYHIPNFTGTWLYY